MHYDLENPEFIKSLDFETIAYPTDMQNISFGYSAPFKVISGEGERVLRELIRRHEHYAKGNTRQQKSLRGLGYLSKFIEEMVYSPVFLEHVSKIAGEPLCPSTFGMHITQVNFGKPGVAAGVDKWHFDSVDYVLVVMLSDLEGMIGGELEVLERNLGG